MSIDSTSSSVHCKKALKSSLSQADNYPYSRHSLKDCQNRSCPKDRNMSISEETSGDLLTDLSSLPFNANKQIDHKFNRRFSEMKSPSVQQEQQQQRQRQQLQKFQPIPHSERRNSMPQINFSSLLPNPFRSKKHQHKNTVKDDINSTAYTSNSIQAFDYNDMMTMKTEQPLPPKPSHINTNYIRAALSTSSDHLSTSIGEDSTSSISSLSSLFIFDTNQCEPQSAENLTLKLNTPLCAAEIYREHFFDYFHTNYCGEFEQEGPFVASLRYFYSKPILSDSTSCSIDTNINCEVRAIIRIPSRNYDVSVTVDGINEDNVLQVLFNKAHLSTAHIFKTIGDPKANEKIYSFDKSNDEKQHCKIGVIYQSVDQTNEYDIFSNDLTSNEMTDFLSKLSDYVRLKGFTKYRGDLDVKDDLHGPYSYYTNYKHHEIMFNVAPMVPSTKANGQCIERKSLVGNAFVCIVFQERDAEFIPDWISGKVTQIYITVQPQTQDDGLYYKIGVWHRNDITSTIDPPGGTFKSDESFRNYFLTLLLNSINVAIESPSLRFRIVEQRQRSKQEQLKKLSQSLTVGPIIETTSDVETISNLKTQPHHSGGDNISIASTSVPTESIPSSSGRTSPVSVKKTRTFSKIFDALIGRSPSVSSASPSSTSVPSTLGHHNISPASSIPQEMNSTQSKTSQTLNRDLSKRSPSVKGRPAPPPPITATSVPHISVAHNHVNNSTQSINLTRPSSHSTALYSVDSNSEKRNPHLSTVNNHFNMNTIDGYQRSRSNSSPGESIEVAAKTQFNTVPKIYEEVDSTNSSLDDDYDGEISEEEKLEHRQTLTEPPLVSALNSNS